MSREFEIAAGRSAENCRPGKRDDVTQRKHTCCLVREGGEGRGEGLGVGALVFVRPHDSGVAGPERFVIYSNRLYVYDINFSAIC